MKTEKKSANPIRVLLMEDEPSVAQLIRLHLSSRGFVVDIASDGERGLAMFKPGEYDVLVIDHKLPKREGLEVIRELKQRGSLPAIVMISGLGMDRVAVEALKLGALDYMAKDPGSQFLDNLPLVLTETLRKYRENEELRVAGEERTRWLHELKQRIRELGCLYGIEKLLATEAESIDVSLESIVNVVPRACRHPDICWVRIWVDGREFQSSEYADSPWKTRIDLKLRDRTPAYMEVGYREKMPGPSDVLFTPEELDLLYSVADRLSVFLERWRTERELRTTHEELRKLHRALEQSASAVLITNTEGIIEYVNPAFTVMTSYPRDEAIGQTPSLLKSGEKRPQEYADLWRMLRSGREWRGEFHNRRKDGSLYWDYSIISPITNPQGEVTHYVAVKEDITEDKESEQLREAVLQLSARIAGCVTEDEICRVVVEGIRETMNVDRCGLFLGNPNDPTFRGTYGTDLNGNTTDEHNHLWNIRKERDVVDLFASAAYKTGFPLGAPEAMPGEEGIFSTLVALKRSGQVFGVISIDNRLSRRLVTESQMAHIALLAEVLGNALQVAHAREELRKSVEETTRANDELEEFNRAMVGRENRIIELKEEINALLGEQGKPVRYEEVWKHE